MNYRKILQVALTVAAMTVAAAGLSLAAGVSPTPHCGQWIDYFSDASHTTQIGFEAKEPESPCGCGYWSSGSTSPFYEVHKQLWCF